MLVDPGIGMFFTMGFFGNSGEGELKCMLEKGVEVSLSVDEPRRMLNTRLHSAGHLLDNWIANIGWEYRGTVPKNELQFKRKELEAEASKLISSGGKASVCSYEDACKLCGGNIPDYIPKESTPQIVKFGEYPGCPCGGTHVSDVSEIISFKVSQIRTRKGTTKVFYNV